MQQLTSQHLPQVLELCASDPFAWPENIWFNSLKNNWVQGCLVKNKLIALSVVQFNPFDAELLYVLVSPSKRQQGLAKQLLTACLAKCEAKGAERLMLEVRASNLHATNLYKSLGFEQDGKRKNYYPIENSSAKEDALLFSCWLV